MKGRTWLRRIVLCGLLLPGLLPLPAGTAAQARGPLRDAQAAAATLDDSTADSGEASALTSTAPVQSALDVRGLPVVVDTGLGANGGHTSLAVVAGNPAISYYDGSNSRLKYVRALDVYGDTWGTPVVVDEGGWSVGRNTSLVVVAGSPAISYRDESDTDYPAVKYVRALDAYGDTWGTPVVVYDGYHEDAGPDISLAVVDGYPAISFAVYHDEPPWDYSLKYRRALDAYGDTWGTPVVVYSAPGPVGRSHSLAVVNGNPAISYYDGAMQYVRALDPAGDDWSMPFLVDAAGDVGIAASLAVVDGRPAISYYDATNGDLKYVSALDANGYIWGAPLVLDAEENVGQSSSLAVVAGNPAISYYDWTNGDLKYVAALDPGGEQWLPGLMVDTEGNVGSYTSMAVVDGQPAISYFDTTNGNLKYVRSADWFSDFDYYMTLGDGHLAAGRAYRLGFHQVLTGTAPITLADIQATYEESGREEFLLGREAYETALTYAATPAEIEEALTGALDTYWELATGSMLVGNEYVVQALDVMLDDPYDPLPGEIEQLQIAIDWYTQATNDYVDLLGSEYAADALALQPDRIHPVSGDPAPYLDIQRLTLVSAGKSRAYLALAERQFRQFTPASKAEAESTLRHAFALATAELALLDDLWDGAADEAAYHTVQRNMSDMQRLFDYLQEDKNPFGYGSEFVPFQFDPDNLPANNYEQTKVLADGEKENAETAVLAAVGMQEEADDNWVILQQRLEASRLEYDSKLVALCGTNEGGEPDLEWCHLNSEGEFYAQVLRVTNANLRIVLVQQQMDNQNELIRIEQERAAKVAGIQRATAELLDPETSERYSDLMSQVGETSRTKNILGGLTNLLGGILAGAQRGKAFGPEGVIAGGILGGLVGIPGMVGACREQGPSAQEKRTEFLIWQQAVVHYAEAEITDAESEALIKQYMLRFKEYDIELSIALNNLQQELARLNALKTQVEYLLAEKARADAFTVALYQDPAGRVMRDYYMELAAYRFGVALDYAYRAGRALEYEINEAAEYAGPPLTDLDDLYHVRDIVTLDAALAQMNTAWYDWEGENPTPSSSSDVVYLSQAVGFEDAYDADLDRIVTREEKFNAFVSNPANWVDLDGDGEKESLRFTFQTSIFLGNRFFSTNVYNDKIESIQARIRGTNLGDGEAYISLKQSGTSFIRTRDAFQNNGPDEVQEYNLAPLTSRVEVAVNDDSFPQVNQELACRSVASTNWTLTLDKVNEPKNWDVDIESIDEIELHITHEAYTLQGLQRDPEIFEPPANRPYQPVERASTAMVYVSPLNASIRLTPDWPGSTELTGSFIGTVVISSPLYLPVLDLALVLTDTDGSLSGYIDSANALGYPIVDAGSERGPALSGAWGATGPDLQSEVYASPTPTITRQVILHTSVITGDGEILVGEYSETLWGLAPDPLVMWGRFELRLAPRLEPSVLYLPLVRKAAP